ncbi:hypothetical protein CBL_01155 [Carabus blaptoides fortunei]
MAFSLRLQRFCCCCTLRTGTLVIGTLGWLNTLSQIFFVPQSSHLSIDEYGHSEYEPLTDNYSLRTRIGACMISLLVSVLLIVGVYKKNNKFMLPWLVLQCLGLIVISILCPICFGAIFFVDSNHTGLFIGLAIVLFLLGSVGWYCWICVWSHYMELNDSDAMVPSKVQYAPTYVNPPPYSKADAPLV